MSKDGRRRRVLFVSYWMPPRTGIGSIRAAHLLKYLPQYGWDVTALTARLAQSHGRVSGTQYVETGYWDVKGAVKSVLGIGERSTHQALNVDVPAYGANRTMVQRLISAAGGIFAYPDEHAGWLAFAAAAIKRLLHTNRFDVILTSAPPFTAHIAAALSRGTVPWVADLRDLWAEDDSSERSAIQTLFDDKLERWCLSRAGMLTASSTLSALRFQRRYPGKGCRAISTGFDDDEWHGIPFAEEAQCTFLYAGTLYRGKRDPSMLFTAVREILDEGHADEDELLIDFYCAPETWLLQQIATFRLQRIVRVMGFVKRDAVLAAERRADRLLVLTWDGCTAEGVVPGKLFEYFGARRPILAIGGPASSSVADLLHQTQAGVRVRTVEAIKREILSAVAQHRRGKSSEVTRRQIAAFTARACAAEFADVLNYAASSSVGAATRRKLLNTAMPANTAK